MKRTIYQPPHKQVTLEILAYVESYMLREELDEMNFKMNSLMNSLSGIPDVQTRALMEQTFKRGYLAAHIQFGEDGN